MLLLLLYPKHVRKQLGYISGCYKNVGVNRAPVRIRHSGRARDSGRDFFF